MLGSHDKTVKFWNIRSGEMNQVIEFDYIVGYVSFFGDDDKVIVSCEEKKVYLVDVDKGTIEVTCQGPSGKDG